jgi:hypothetical protein
MSDCERPFRLNDYVPSYRGVFCWDPQDKNVGADPAGLFVVDTRVRPPREVFRSLRCSQEVIRVTRTWRSKLLRLPDARTGRSVTVRLPDAPHRQVSHRAAQRAHHRARRRSGPGTVSAPPARSDQRPGRGRPAASPPSSTH